MMKHYEKNPPLNMMVKTYLGINTETKKTSEEMSFDDFARTLQQEGFI